MKPWMRVTNMILTAAIPVLEHLAEQLPDNKQAQEIVPDVVVGLQSLQALLQGL